MIKKILIFFLFLTFPMTTFAITLGSSLGLNLGSLKLHSKEKNVFRYTEKDSSLDLGFFYKYNWNIKRIIVGVEFFYDYLNLKTDFKNNSVNFRYRYGANLNLGYDISDNFSLYGIAGYGLIKYKAYSYDDGYFKINETKSRPLYGIGIGYSLSPSWKIGLEYTLQTLNVKLSNAKYNIKNKIHSVDFGIIYKF